MAQIILTGIEKIKPLIEGKKIFLVKDSAYDTLSVKQTIDLYNCTEFSGFTPNPKYEQVVDGVNTFNRKNCEIIISAGGGSAIDVAKCIKLFCKMDSSVNYLKQGSVETDVQLIAIPTTAGTGSESTRYAVIYYNGEKQSITDEHILPDYAIIEPDVVKTLPLYQKKCTLLDALCQSIESWWSISSTDESKEYSRNAIALIKENYEEYICKGTENSSEKIMYAANYSGRAINITATTAAHAMSYKLTSLYGLPHGHAVAVCMNEVWEYIMTHTENCTDRRGRAYLNSMLSEISEMLDIDYFRHMLKKMKIGLPKSKKRNIDIEMLTKSVNPERLKGNPVKINTEDFIWMYGRIIKQ